MVGCGQPKANSNNAGLQIMVAGAIRNARLMLLRRQPLRVKAYGVAFGQTS